MIAYTVSYSSVCAQFDYCERATTALRERTPPSLHTPMQQGRHPAGQFDMRDVS